MKNPMKNNYELTLTLSEIDFWQRMYASSLQGGHCGTTSVLNADRAVLRKRLRFDSEEIDRIAQSQLR